jgi:GntR family transcriptional repressor for pyruvate dehydrogenase complex
MLKRANRSTRHGDIMQQMIKAIQEKQWAPGSKLPSELELAETFGVSRTSIREVLKALAHSGVLEAHPGKGTFLSPSAEEILSGTKLTAAMFSEYTYTELIEVRRLLEGQAVYWATERASPEDIARLEELLKGNEGETSFEIHDKFHTAIVEMSGNRLLIKLMASLRDEIVAQREFHNVVLPDTDRQQQWQIFEAIKSRSPKKAFDAMMKHINVFWEKLA